MEKNKIGKYLKYAFGEIVLVVIGILIALSINNWNDKRETDNRIKDIYVIIQNDLLTDIETIDKLLVSSEFRDSIFKRVLNKEMTNDDYLKCNRCISILGGYPDIKLKTGGLKLLEENSTFLNSIQDRLSVKVIGFYHNFNTEIEVAIEEVDQDYSDNRYHFKNNKPWFEDYQSQLPNEDFIKYALESQDYRNRVRSFYGVYYELYLGLLKDYRASALILVEEINKGIK
tara:strand:+ start:104 stop:790 length:687 start_codon:yes stop_codon:yes gene_type:complete